MKERKKEYFSTYLYPEQIARLKEISATTNVAMAVYVRQAIDLVLELHRKVSKGTQSSQGKEQ